VPRLGIDDGFAASPIGRVASRQPLVTAIDAMPLWPVRTIISPERCRPLSVSLYCMTTQVSVERVINAPASSIFELLADPSRHAEIDGSGTVKGTGEPSTRLSLGAQFGMNMKMGFGYRMVNTVIEFEDDRRIAWQPRPDSGLLAKAVGGRIWRYELEPVDGGTLVRETWDTSEEKAKLFVTSMAPKVKKSIEATLQRIADRFE
jgi:uncharacterized protein YndB with AHSA1/START domain